jgi:hypothetical protein
VLLTPVVPHPDGDPSVLCEYSVTTAPTAPHSTTASAAPPPTAADGTCSLENIDVVFVTEGFNDVTAEQYQEVLDFISDFAGKARVTEGTAQVGMYHFNRLAGTNSILLGEHGDLASLQAAIQGFAGQHQSALQHDLVSALDHGVTAGFGAVNGQNPDFHDVLVFLTDGSDQLGNESIAGLLAGEAAALAANISVFAIGVGDQVVREQLDAIAGSHDRVYMGFTALADVEEQLCQEVSAAHIPDACIVHGDHFDQSYTRAHCDKACERASFPDHSASCTMVGVDVIVVMEGFASADDVEFENILGALQGLLDKMDPALSQMAIYSSSIATENHLHFNSGIPSTDLGNVLRTRRGQPEQVDLTAALMNGLQMGTNSSNGNDPNNRDILILITNGQDVRGPTALSGIAAAADAYDVQVFALGVADAVPAELEAATGRADRIFFMSGGDPTEVTANLHLICRDVMAPMDEVDCGVAPYFLEGVDECKEACLELEEDYASRQCLDLEALPGQPCVAYNNLPAGCHVYKDMSLTRTFDGKPCVYAEQAAGGLLYDPLQMSTSLPNYCSNADDEAFGPYCYTLDAEVPGSVEKSPCFESCPGLA